MPDVPDLDDVADGLTRKVGPLPAWVWATIVVGGVTAAIVIRRRLQPADDEPAEPGLDDEPGDAFADDTATGPSPFLPGGFVVGGGPTQATGGTSTDVSLGGGSGADEPTTNSEWQTIAARYLIGRGYQGTVVTDALARYLSGRELTTQGQAIVDAAIGGIGAPPAPVPPPVVSPKPEPVPSPGGGGTAPDPKPKPKPAPKPKPKPAPKPKPKPAPKPAPANDTSGDLVVTVKSGQTLWSLASFFTGGRDVMNGVRRIAKYNNITLGPAPHYVPSPWRVGQRVIIPGPNATV